MVGSIRLNREDREFKENDLIVQDRYFKPVRKLALLHRIRGYVRVTDVSNPCSGCWYAEVIRFNFLIWLLPLVIAAGILLFSMFRTAEERMPLEIDEGHGITKLENGGSIMYSSIPGYRDMVIETPGQVIGLSNPEDMDIPDVSDMLDLE